MNRLKRVFISVLALSLAACMAGCKSGGKLSHSNFKSAAKKSGATVVENSTDFAKVANQISGYSVFISQKGSDAQSLFESQITKTATMPAIKEFSIFMSAPDDSSICYITMVTFDDEKDANDFYKMNCSQVKGNILGNDGYSFNLKYQEKDGTLRQEGAYQKGKTVIYALSENVTSKQFAVLEDICRELGIKSPAEANRKMQEKIQ